MGFFVPPLFNPYNPDQNTFDFTQLNHAQNMLDALRCAMKAGTNVLSINVDGQSITYQSREQMMREYLFWSKRVSRRIGMAPRVSSIYLGNF